MKRINYGIYGLVIVAAISCFFSCTKQDETYKQFLEGGEIVYVEKADSLRAYSGQNRVKLSWVISADPDVTYARVFWNNGADSMEVPITRTTGRDKIEVILDNLAEGSYTFDVYNYDDAGNSSIKTDVFAPVYGDNYTASLFNRVLRGVVYGGDNLELTWYGADNTDVGTEVTYTDVSDVQRKVTVLPGDSIFWLVDYKPNTPFEYVTSYKPDSTAIDTFYTEATTVEVQMQHRENIDLDKSLFSELALPGDGEKQDIVGMQLSNLWSGVLAGNQEVGAWYRTKNGSIFPLHFQFDLGVAAKLNSFTMWQRGTLSEHNLVYNNANVKTWEIWGSNNPAPDGSFDGWVKLLDCEAHKPSGAPVGTLTPEDIAYAQAGDEFEIPADMPSVRYIRLNILGIYGSQTAMFISEVSLNGSYWEITDWTVIEN